MTEPGRVMLEGGKKKRVVASAFDVLGWDRSITLGGGVLAVLDSYRHCFAKVTELAGYGDSRLFTDAPGGPSCGGPLHTRCDELSRAGR